MREIKKKMNKKLNSAIKEIESKAIDFFNIPKEVANDPSLNFGQKIVLAVALDEIGKIYESGDKPSYDEALDNRRKAIFISQAQAILYMLDNNLRTLLVWQIVMGIGA